MVLKKLPFTKSQIEEIVKTYPTPFHIYDEKEIRDNAKDMIQSFSNVKGFKEFFAVKALPNPYILKILAEHGFGADCSSLPELLLAEKAGITGENIMFSSNNTPADEFIKAKEMGAIINLDDISHIEFLEEVAGLPDIVCFRYNPGPLKGGNELIGKPEEAKYGFTREQLFSGYEMLKQKGVKRFGLHTMVASNELNVDYFVETARILFEVIVEISQKVGIEFEFVNLGGGIGIPYRPDQERILFSDVAAGVKAAYDATIGKAGVAQPNVYFECGRVITGPYGYLVTEVRHMKHIYKDYVGTDACMANLMRPGIYGAYHHITVLGKENASLDHKYDVTGSLCENNDKFAIDRMLPGIERGDLLVIHDTGAHGFAMGFNYNGKLRSAELLLRPDGSVKQIRRAETIDDYFATLDFGGLKSFK
ncbi:MAG: diaminopimelate decarboxylase [Methanosarcinales archaeon]|jgi:diaminopimelate decarboxylase|nr:diaminopimelate decarboxylase [Methanosarcinales archaeon]